MRYIATYKDKRDPDESAIGEGFTSIDDASDAIVRYFRKVPTSYSNMEYWTIRNSETDGVVASGQDCIL